MTATNARKDLYRLIDQVNDDRSEIEITGKSNSAFLISSAEYSALQETAHLLRSPVNAARLAASADQVRRGAAVLHDLVDADRDDASA